MLLSVLKSASIICEHTEAYIAFGRCVHSFSFLC